MGAFAANTFTAPATGRYRFAVHLTLTSIPGAGNVQLVRTGGSYLLWSTTVAANEAHAIGSVVVPMTAGQTARLATSFSGTFTINGEARQT